MGNWTAITSTLTASFLASLVEVVEAFTIVLAVGITNNWRSAFIGTGVALTLLTLIVVVFGPLLGLIPIANLQFMVGVLLGLFGLRWLRKAILRASGYIPLHDEQKAFAAETEVLRGQSGTSRTDYLAGLAAFKAVLLEGVEVVFIVIAVGTGQGMTFYAGIGALLAVVLVLGVGLMIHKPLARVPENTLKLIVGLMLTSFSVFWIGEGLGVEWPGADLAILAFLAIFTLFALLMISILRTTNAASHSGARS
jgi:uncharacterized membrane protein